MPKVPGRLESIAIGQPFGVFVDYAHTDDALRNVLSTVRECTAALGLPPDFRPDLPDDADAPPSWQDPAQVALLPDLLKVALDNRRLRAAVAAPQDEVAPVERPDETAAEAIAVLDAQFPWLRGAPQRRRPRQP